MISGETPRFEWFSLRLLSPYRGAAQVVSAGDARAISRDGESWEIQVNAERPADLWASHAVPASRFLFRFGRWHRRIGLDRVPVNPILDNSRIIPAAERLLGKLEKVEKHVPFPHRDHLELWLLDTENSLPLALLASSISTAGFDRYHDRTNWIPVTDDWSAKPLAAPLRDYAALVARRVAAQAGPSPRPRWFRRARNRGGCSLDPDGHPLAGGELPPDAFPELLCRTIQVRPGIKEPEAEAYLAAMAPRLLMLPYLSDPERSRLEHLARRRAMEVAAGWRVYPKVIHRDLLEQALVEARLRGANEEDGA